MAALTDDGDALRLAVALRLHLPSALYRSSPGSWAAHLTELLDGMNPAHVLNRICERADFPDHGVCVSSRGPLCASPVPAAS